jgi:MFS family permease
MTNMSAEGATGALSTPNTPLTIAEPEVPGTSMTYLGGRPQRRYVLWYGLTTVVIFAGLQAVGAILLPNQVQLLEFARWFTGADAHVNLTALENLRNAVNNGLGVTSEQQRLLHLLAQFDASRAQALALVSSLGIVGTTISQPIIGVLSDRTRSRMGRRAPWLLLGGSLGTCFLVGLRFAPTVAVLTLLWCVAQTAMNMAGGMLNTTVADRIPESKRGMVSAVAGLGNFMGAIGGVLLAGALFASLGLNCYLLFAAILLVGILGFVLLNPDRSSRELAVPSHQWGSFWRGFLVPLLDSDFRWVWLARLVLLFGYGTTTSLAFYVMQSYITPALSAQQATQMVPLLSLAGLPATIIALVIAGRLSDKLGRRKPFVMVASLLFAVSATIPLLWPTLAALFAQNILGGIAFGIYLPVDQALFIDVLPDKQAAGRDLGMANVATWIGQALSPLLAAQIVALTGGYRMIWIVAITLVLIAAVAIIPVRRVH